MQEIYFPRKDKTFHHQLSLKVKLFKNFSSLYFCFRVFIIPRFIFAAWLIRNNLIYPEHWKSSHTAHFVLVLMSGLINIYIFQAENAIIITQHQYFKHVIIYNIRARIFSRVSFSPHLIKNELYVSVINNSCL